MTPNAHERPALSWETASGMRRPSSGPRLVRHHALDAQAYQRAHHEHDDAEVGRQQVDDEVEEAAAGGGERHAARHRPLVEARYLGHPAEQKASQAGPRKPPCREVEGERQRHAERRIGRGRHGGDDAERRHEPRHGPPCTGRRQPFGGTRHREAAGPETDEERDAQGQVVPQPVDAGIQERVAHEHGEEAGPEERHASHHGEKHGGRYALTWRFAAIQTFFHRRSRGPLPHIAEAPPKKPDDLSMAPMINGL